MKSFPKKTIVLFAVVLGALLVLRLMRHAVGPVFVEGGNVDFSFYGKLVDHENNPIPNITINYNVEVLMSLNGFHFQGPNPSSEVTTDNQGCFLIQGFGRELDIQQLRDVPGYEYVHTKTGFNLISTYPREHFVADEVNPFVFTLRKKSMPAYLLGNRPMGRLRGVRILEDVTDEISISVYLVDPWIDPDGLPGNFPGEEESKYGQVKPSGNKDLLIEGSLSADETQYDFEISPIPSSSGIILSDQLLYEAPETGYQSAVQLSVPTGTVELKKYLYIKLDNGKFYGRLDAEFGVDSPGESSPVIKVFINAWINPSGSRNLEFDEAFQRDEKNWRYMLNRMRGRDDFEGVNESVRSAERAEEFGLKRLPKFVNPDQFLNELRQLRAAKNKKNPQWWHNPSHFE